MKSVRSCGVLMHVSSLPSKHGLGDFGPQAHAFIDFLASAGQSLWQTLPLVPINAGAGNSPYSSYSAFAGNTLFISPEMLVRQGVLSRGEVDRAPRFSADRVDYAAAAVWRWRILNAAFDNVFSGLRTDRAFERFCREEAWWLDDYCLFAALKRDHGGAGWFHWPRELRLREPAALAKAGERLAFDILREKHFQHLFALQWGELRQYASRQGVRLIGDVPIYVSLDSCDVWSHRELFELDDDGLPIYAAGAPPDYFSETGQMWGNPVYDWAYQEREGFSWWGRRLGHENRRFDLIRLDHFRGFCGFWQVPACEPTAENGLWIPGPGEKLFDAVRESVPGLALLAEDLGVITPDVVALMEKYGFPGMKVLQFAFSEDMGKSAYIPHNITAGSAVYTGTHDNNTTRGWFAGELGDDGKRRFFSYAGRMVDEDGAADALIRMAMGSVASMCLIPMQDYLNIGKEGRMNVPGVAQGNWEWRMRQETLTDALRARMRELADIYGRLPD